MWEIKIIPIKIFPDSNNFCGKCHVLSELEGSIDFEDLGMFLRLILEWFLLVFSTVWIQSCLFLDWLATTMTRKLIWSASLTEKREVYSNSKIWVKLRTFWTTLVCIVVSAWQGESRWHSSTGPHDMCNPIGPMIIVIIN